MKLTARGTRRPSSYVCQLVVNFPPFLVFQSMNLWVGGAVTVVGAGGGILLIFSDKKQILKSMHILMYFAN